MPNPFIRDRGEEVRMSRKIASFDMEMKFHSIIRLFAEALYPEPDVFIRELIQNAHDSIVRHKAENPNLDGRINVRTDIFNQTIIIEDNGIGMDEFDIKNFLSVIGSTETGDIRNKGVAISYELIGQFGIGLLSSFVVADKVYVETKKLGARKAFQWRNDGSDKCELYDSDKKGIGSTISVYMKNNYTYFLNPTTLREVIIKYCDFISLPIYLNGEGPVNAKEAPWNKAKYGDQNRTDRANTEYIVHRFSETALHSFVININENYKAKGLLYISKNRIPNNAPGGLLDIFIRGMLVKKDDHSLLPSWAKFIRGAIESPDLKPTTSRDNILMGDPSFEEVRDNLGRRIVDNIMHIAANSQQLIFKSVNERHYYHLKDMAQYYEDFFDQFSKLLLFETNKGMISLEEYISKNPLLPDGRAPIYFFSKQEFSDNYYHLANAKELVVINAGRIDINLLRKYVDKNMDKVALRMFDLQSDSSVFLDLSEKECTEFDAKYKSVEKAVRAIFEAPPFFFEVRLAHEYTYRGNTLNDNVKKHIACSHAFIAEISDLNPNVMLEVGAIVMRYDDRPVFSLRSEDAKDAVPSDIKDKLYIPYSSPSASEEDIKSAILKAIMEHGRIKHESIEMLIKMRRTHFLSRTVCANLHRITLKESEINSLMKYETIESLLQAEPEAIAKEVGIPKSIVVAIQEQLREAIQI